MSFEQLLMKTVNLSLTIPLDELFKWKLYFLTDLITHV